MLNKLFIGTVSAILAACALGWLSRKGMFSGVPNELNAVGSPDAVKDNRATLPRVNAADFAASSSTLTAQATLPPP